VGADEAKYVFRNYMNLMTRKEAQAFRHISGTMKATGRSDASQEEVKGGSSISRKWLSDDPEVRLLAQDGYDAFVLVTGKRILRDNRDRIVMNYCPRCGGLARTPKARQCRFCGKDWHNEIEG